MFGIVFIITILLLFGVSAYVLDRQADKNKKKNIHFNTISRKAELSDTIKGDTMSRCKFYNN
jgi:hypothetical protein